ncbi:MAG: ABC transporter permease [Myxococcales bacterium]|nr:ABC transporter permease [Myxococcales bacterium]
MRNVALIVRRELLAYLRTPSGWVIAALVLLVNGLAFNAWAVGNEARESTVVLVRYLDFAGGMAIVTAALFSMRLLAEERASGTHVLLFTSPIREHEIVLGKYLASLVFVTLVLLASLYLPALIFIRGKVSWGHIFSGYLGLVLLGATTLAIGTFASSLVRHPFLAVLVTGAFAGLLELCWWAALVAEPPLRDILAYLAPFYGHYRPELERGTLRLSDLVFFASLSWLSLVAATRVLKTQRWQ